MKTVAATRPTEAQCLRTIIQAAKLCGWHIQHSRPAMNGKGRWMTPIQGHAGFPDLILVRGKELWFVELKRKPNRVEPAQKRWLEMLAATGATVHVIWVPEGLDAFLTMLAKPPAAPL